MTWHFFMPEKVHYVIRISVGCYNTPYKVLHCQVTFAVMITMGNHTATTEKY
jgi:hypothetical protein